jgi:hypothetical protein
VLDGAEVVSLLDRGFRGIAKGCVRAGMRRSGSTNQGPPHRRAAGYNRVQAGLPAPVEQAIEHLTNAWDCAAAESSYTGSAVCTGLLPR